MSVGWDEVFPEPAPVPGRFVTRRRILVVPFEPVTIDPGDSRYLILQLKIEGQMVCGQSGGSAQVTSRTRWR